MITKILLVLRSDNHSHPVKYFILAPAPKYSTALHTSDNNGSRGRHCCPDCEAGSRPLLKMADYYHEILEKMAVQTCDTLVRTITGQHEV